MNLSKQVIISTVLLLTLGLCGNVFAFTLTGHIWTEGRTDFQVRLSPNTPTSAASGITGADFDAAFLEAAQIWNNTSAFRFDTQNTAEAPCANLTSNSVGFTDDLCGEEFGSSTLAVALTSSFSTGEAVQSVIVFNNAFTWGIYNGPRFFRQDVDFRRVAVHELGHTLGLDHSDDTGAIMFPTVGNIEVAEADDLAGVAFLYDGDSDNVGLYVDNCPSIANEAQSNIDGDTLGDACDGDVDGDGVFNGLGADQSFGLNNLSSSFFEFGDDQSLNGLAQSFQVGISGELQSVTLPVFCTDGDLQVSIRNLDVFGNPSNASNDILQSVTLTSGLDEFAPIVIDLPPRNYTVGENLAVVVQSSGVCGWQALEVPESYSEGSLHATNDGVFWFATSQDLAFQTNVFPDVIDNCVTIPNVGQQDTDDNGVGDACEGLETPIDDSDLDDQLCFPIRTESGDISLICL